MRVCRRIIFSSFLVIFQGYVITPGFVMPYVIFLDSLPPRQLWIKLLSESM